VFEGVVQTQEVCQW